MNWESIPSFPEYQASESGVIRRTISARFSGPFLPLSPYLAKRGGYLTVWLWHNARAVQRPIHVLVCEAFHGEKPSPQHEVAHWDGDKYNNRPSNLRWATRPENEGDKVRHGRSNRGERCAAAKLTVEQVERLRTIWPTLPRSSGGARIKKGATADLERELEVTRSALYGAVRGIHWGAAP